MNSRCVNMGNIVRAALNRSRDSGEATTSGDPWASGSGNGLIMRLAPVPMAFADLYPDQAELLADRAEESSLPTHASAQCRSACRYFAVVLVALAHGVERDEVLSPTWPLLDRLGPLDPKVDAVARGSVREKSPPEIQDTGYVVESLEAALGAFHQAPGFRQAVLCAVNLGHDADTTGAVCGQLAGACWGEGRIPGEWRGGVAGKHPIRAALSGLLAGRPDEEEAVKPHPTRVKARRK